MHCAGIGMSTDMNRTEASTVLGYATATAALIQALRLDQPDILGTSVGGFEVLTIAVNFPEMVNHVVLGDTSSGGALGITINTVASSFASDHFNLPDTLTLVSLTAILHKCQLLQLHSVFLLKHSLLVHCGNLVSL